MVNVAMIKMIITIRSAMTKTKFKPFHVRLDPFHIPEAHGKKETQN